MNNSLKTLLEVDEGFTPKEELIAKILMNSTEDEDSFQELAQKLESDQISLEDANASLESMTQPNEAMNEDHDQEGRMSKHDLLKLTQYSAKLYKSLQDGDELPGWIQAKITLAADYIGTVKHYLEGEEVMDGEEAPSDQLEEAVEEVGYYNWEDLHLDIFVNKPVEDILDAIMLPLPTDGRKQLNLGNYKRVLELPEDYKSKFGTKEELVKRELGYVERDFTNWKEGFDLEGDEEVLVRCEEFACVVEVEAIKKMSDEYSAAKAKGDTKDVYESSLLNILSK